MGVKTRDPEGAVEPVVQQGRWPESTRPMSLGLMLPIAEQNAVANDSPVDGFWDIVAMARLAVEIGFDMLWLPDHFMLKLERHGGQARGVWECWTTTAGIAAALPGIPIGTMVACTSFHNPGSIAKMAETVDDISQGNFVLGLGCGWHADEYHMYGLPFDHRVDRFEEALRIISPLVRTGRASFEGEYYQAREAINFPRGPRRRQPVRHGRVPGSLVPDPRQCRRNGRGDAFVPGCGPGALPLRPGSVHDGDTARFCEGDRGVRPGVAGPLAAHHLLPLRGARNEKRVTRPHRNRT